MKGIIEFCKREVVITTNNLRNSVLHTESSDERVIKSLNIYMVLLHTSKDNTEIIDKRNCNFLYKVVNALIHDF